MSKCNEILKRINERSGTNFFDVYEAITGREMPPECPTVDCLNDITDALREALTENDKDQLPEGVEWPRFKDGRLVKIGDEVVFCGCKFNSIEKIRNICFSHFGTEVIFSNDKRTIATSFERPDSFESIIRDAKMAGALEAIGQGDEGSSERLIERCKRRAAVVS